MDFGHRAHPVVCEREEAGCVPSARLSKRLASDAVNRGQSDLVAAVKESGFVEQVGRIRLGQLDDRRVGRVVHGRAYRRIGAVAPQRREEVLGQRVMEIVPHQLELAVDGVVDAHNVFPNIGRLRNGRDVLRSVVEVWFRERARIQLKNRILVDQVGGDDVARERLSWCQTVSRVESQFGRIGGDRNDAEPSRSVACRPGLAPARREVRRQDGID